jgi:hypothetical protein
VTEAFIERHGRPPSKRRSVIHLIGLPVNPTFLSAVDAHFPYGTQLPEEMTVILTESLVNEADPLYIVTYPPPAPAPLPPGVSRADDGTMVCLSNKIPEGWRWRWNENSAWRVGQVEMSSLAYVEPIPVPETELVALGDIVGRTLPGQDSPVESLSLRGDGATATLESGKLVPVLVHPDYMIEVVE